MERDFSKAKRADRKVSQEIADLIKTIPDGDDILVFNFNTRDVDIEGILREDLKHSGVDLARVSFLTWGQHTALNTFSHCQHVILVGILQRSEADITSSILGQQDNIDGETTSSKVQETILSEMGHVVYQALSRGSCRRVSGGKAMAMNAYLIHRYDNIRPLINKVMAKVNWVEWEPQHVNGAAERKTQKTSKRIEEALRDYSGTTISSRALKRMAGLEDVPPQSFKRAKAMFLDHHPEWELNGRSLERI
jgi:hypothetical protein